MVIRRTDRVGEVLERDERMLDAFLAVSPAFRGLRNPLLRRTMGRLSTVEQAARVAGIDPDALVASLNAALGEAGAAQAAGAEPAPEEHGDPPAEAGPPTALARIPADRVVELDVREALRSGEEPFSRIMAARRQVPPGGALRLRAIFEPAPLYAVLAKQGLDHWTERHADDDWEVWFYAAPADGAETAAPRAAAPPPPAAPVEGDEGVVVVDVRGMEPPEPMVRTLAALEDLPPGGTLVQVNERVPRFLLPKLEELGFRYEVREQPDAIVRVFIRRGDG